MSAAVQDLLWIVFIATLIVMLFIDFWQQSRTNEEMPLKKAVYWSIAWVVTALAFNLLMGGILYFTDGSRIALEYSTNFLSGYVVEKSLAIDNVFVWMIIFNYFDIPAKQQKRVLLYGVLGAITLRIVMILLTSMLIAKFSAVLYLFGLFLLFIGFKSFCSENKNKAINHRWLNQIKRFFYDDPAATPVDFWVKIAGRWRPTLLLLVLILIELSDIIFAIDSIPAVFAITTQTFIVISSNLFALLGLRSLYFLISIMVKRYDFLHYAVALLLIFVGIKILCSAFLPISALVSLLIILMIFILTYCVERFFIKRTI